VTRLNLNETVCEALFASSLQPSDAPTAEAVAAAIGRTVRQLGQSGCASNVAQEFGDHPDTACERMRWVRELASSLCSGLVLPTKTAPDAPVLGTDLLPVRGAA
jgi:hypothetical protein